VYLLEIIPPYFGYFNSRPFHLRISKYIIKQAGTNNLVFWGWFAEFDALYEQLKGKG
jgi:hypothetical protein